VWLEFSVAVDRFPRAAAGWETDFGKSQPDSPCLLSKAMKTVEINDTVRRSGLPQLWRVVNTINGSKADIQRLHDDDPQIVTITVDNIQIVRRFGSPNSLF
jgi:hypothetical protein